jgi:site-specific DNA-methyltransferase (adenine-specific)
LTTKENDLVIDPFAGSFTTAISCLELNRKYICIEKDKEYFEVGKNRIAKWHEENNQKDLFSCN